MCGIIGLLARTETLRASFGAQVMPMFRCMAERGPDSAGIATFDQPVAPSLRRYNLFAFDRSIDWRALAGGLEKETGAPVTLQSIDNHAVFTTSLAPAAMSAWLVSRTASLLLLSIGRSLDIYKDMGNPIEIAERYRFSSLRASHGIGHTRMATESAISPAHAHPYSAGEDFALVHNGSLSNPYMLRRMLEARGLRFQTDNDTEAACRFLEWRLREGDTIEAAMTAGFSQLDGFYTLLIATADRMLLARDPFACKPAVVAETDAYVAVASEFRSLAALPDIKNANIYEPRPAEVYSWKV